MSYNCMLKKHILFLNLGKRGVTHNGSRWHTYRNVIILLSGHAPSSTNM
jgi:hypothetical protein